MSTDTFATAIITFFKRIIPELMNSLQDHRKMGKVGEQKDGGKWAEGSAYVGLPLNPLEESTTV